MNKKNGRRATRARSMTTGAVAASAVLLAATTAAGARTFPTHLFVPGSVVVASTTYPAQGDPNIQVGQNLPSGSPAVADGRYPEAFNNDISADGNFAVATPIELLDVNGFGGLLSKTEVPTNQMTTSFSSKSELAINFSTNGQDLSFLGYNAVPDALDSSNSDTPLVRDSTNPDQQGPYNRVAGNLDANGSWTFTDSNAFSGDNGRAVMLDNTNGTFYAAGNSNGGSSKDENPITDSGGAQAFPLSTLSQADQGDGVLSTRLGNFNVSDVGYPPEKKFGKDTNFRGLAIYNNVVYVTKGSGGKGIESVYWINTDPTNNPCQNGQGLPEAGQPMPTISGAPYPICILKGFNTQLASVTTNIFPFGIWFANPTTLYVADEGPGVPSSGSPYAGASSDTMAGLEKWTLQNGRWNYDYTMQAGLNLGQPYTVPGYPKGDNPLPGGTGEPWAPATGGLRNISGQVNGDGSATIYATTSTVSGGGDPGADPNEVVAITDDPNSLTLGTQSFSVVAPPKNRVRYGGVAVVPANYGQDS